MPSSFGNIPVPNTPLANITDPFTTFNGVLSAGIGIITIVAFIWFLYLLVTGAISYMTAGGDKAKIEEAKQKLFTALIGLILVISAVFLVQLIGWLFGIDILNIGGLLNNIHP